MDPQEALRRLADYCKDGTGIKGGGYPIPSTKPNLPAVGVFLTGYSGGEAGRVTYRGAVQELILKVLVRIYVADVNEAEKVVNAGDALVFKIIDRFRLERDNPAITLGDWALEGGMVKHVHILDGQTAQIIPGWGTSFYGAEIPFEIKIARIAEQIA